MCLQRLCVMIMPELIKVSQIEVVCANWRRQVNKAAFVSYQLDHAYFIHAAARFTENGLK